MTLMAWIVAWAVVTTALVVLAYLRLTFGLHEILGVKFGSPEQATSNNTGMNEGSSALTLWGSC